MIKQILTTMLLLASSAVFAGSLSLDGRFDSDSASATFDKDGAVPGYSKYYMQTGRLDYKGKATDDISFRLRVRFNKTPAAVNATDALNDSIDFAQVTHKMGDFSLSAGKFATGMTGFEGATPGADLYFQSQAYKKVASTIYLSGVSGTYMLDTSSFTLMATNNTTSGVVGPANAAGKFNQKAGLFGFTYKGAFMEKALTVMASQHMVNPASSTGVDTKDGSNTYTTVGVKFEQPIWNVSADMNIYSTENTADPKKSDVLSSNVIGFGYNLSDSMALKAKIESSSLKVADTTSTGPKTATTGTGLTFEYKPAKDVDFRYHAAYTSVTAKADTTGALATTEGHLIAGVRIYADFLK